MHEPHIRREKRQWTVLQNNASYKLSAPEARKKKTKIKQQS